jgi:Tfp pilus assembly pilus retraction ATPase PilT
MVLLDDYLADLVRKGIVTRDSALEKANNRKELEQAVSRL